MWRAGPVVTKVGGKNGRRPPLVPTMSRVCACAGRLRLQPSPCSLYSKVEGGLNCSILGQALAAPTSSGHGTVRVVWLFGELVRLGSGSALANGACDVVQRYVQRDLFYCSSSVTELTQGVRYTSPRRREGCGAVLCVCSICLTFGGWGRQRQAHH